VLHRSDAAVIQLEKPPLRLPETKSRRADHGSRPSRRSQREIAPYGGAVTPAAAELRTRAFQALCGLGFKEPEGAPRARAGGRYEQR
jgi:hypothetical protein